MVSTKKLPEDIVERLSKLSAVDVIDWLSHQEGKKIFTTSLGAEDQVLLDIFSKNPKHLAANLSCVTLDTGRLHAETYDLLQSNNQYYKDIPIKVLFPQTTAVENLVNNHGINLFRQNIDLRQACCAIRKVEPLNRALQGATFWLSGLRSNQSVSRKNLTVIEWDSERQLFKISPLWNWSKEDVQAYLDLHSVPRNALHSQGYASIGCAPCTRAIGLDEDERAGRWWWENATHKECGLHLKIKPLGFKGQQTHIFNFRPLETEKDRE